MLGLNLAGPKGMYLTLQQQGINLLRRFGTDAHVYLPGIGTLNGLTAGNYFDSVLTTAATVDNPVGGVVDAVGTINATQATTANKPILRRGALNLLTYSNALTNAAWAKTRVTAALTATNAAGTADTATTLTEDTSSGTHEVGIISSIATTSGAVNTCAVIVRAAGRDFARLMLIDSTFTHRVHADIDLSNGTVGAAVLTGSATSSATPSIVAVGNGYYLVAISGVMSTATSINVFLRAANTSGNVSYVGSGASALHVQAAALIPGIYTTAQILAEDGIPLTTSAAASNPSAGKYSWQFDGSNDYLSLGSAPFQMADDHAVIASGTPTTSTTDCDVFGQRNGGSTNPLAPILRFGADAKVKALYRDDAGTIDTPTMTASYIAGTPYVVSCRKTGNTKVVRANGVDGSTKNTALGATTITTSTIGAGVTTGVLGLFNGSIGPVIAIKGTVTNAELLTLERFVSSLTPSGPIF